MRLRAGLVLGVFSSVGTLAFAQTASGDTAACIDCHSKKTPNIVSDWKLSKHSEVNVSCVACHSDQHTSDSDVAKVRIPTPQTCAQCHQAQVEPFSKGKHSMAWAAMKAMPTIHWQAVTHCPCIVTFSRSLSLSPELWPAARVVRTCPSFGIDHAQIELENGNQGFCRCGCSMKRYVSRWSFATTL